MYYILASTKKPVIRRNLQTRVKYLHKHGLFPRRKVFSFPALTFPVSSSIIMRHSKCGRSSVAEHQLPKLNMRVRFPSPAPAASCRSQVAIITLWWSRFLFPAFLVWVHFYRVHSGKLPLPSRAPHFCGVRFFFARGFAWALFVLYRNISKPSGGNFGFSGARAHGLSVKNGTRQIDFVISPPYNIKKR